MKTKILAACLVLCMVSAMVPASAFAENNETVPEVLGEQMYEGEVNNPYGKVSGNEGGDFSDTQAPDQLENESGFEEEDASGNNKSSVHPSVAEEYSVKESRGQPINGALKQAIIR